MDAFDLLELKCSSKGEEEPQYLGVKIEKEDLIRLLIEKNYNLIKKYKKASLMKERLPELGNKIPEFVTSLTSFTQIDLSNTDLKDVSFFEIGLGATDFSGTTLVNCDFRNLSLENINFKNAILIDCNFDGATLENCNFDSTQFKNIDFSRLREGLLTNSKFLNVLLEGVRFQGINFQNTSFENILINSRFYVIDCLVDSNLFETYIELYKKKILI